MTISNVYAFLRSQPEQRGIDIEASHDLTVA